METVIQQISQLTLQDAGKCDSTFTVDAQLILSAQNNLVQFDIVPVPPYQKQYPAEAIAFNAYVNHPNQTVFLAYVDGLIAGQIRLRRNWNQFAYIEDLVVATPFRRRGLGRALIQTAIQWAKARRLPGLMLETQNNNVAACRLYQTCGFELSGFDRLLYQGVNPGTPEVALYWYLTFGSVQ